MIWVIIGVSGFLLLLFSVVSEYMFYDSRREEYHRIQKEIALGQLAGFKHHQEVVVPLLIKHNGNLQRRNRRINE